MAGPETTHDVRVWSVKKIVGKKRTTYNVRWVVAGRERSSSFATSALADSQRALLVTAMRRGEAFDVERGLPTSMVPAARETTWWEWSLEYVDQKWPALAPMSRRSTAEALTTATMELLAEASGRPPDHELRSVMQQWAFNAARRSAGPPPADLEAAADWLRRSSLPLRTLEDPPAVRRLLDALARKVNGEAAAATTVARKRAVVHNALDLAVERQLLGLHPFSLVRWTAPRVNDSFDPRSVINPRQARSLIAALASLRAGETGRRPKAIAWRGRHLRAFFAAQYFSALRPSEAMALRRSDLVLPEGGGWGQLLLSGGNPDISGSWSDSGQRTSRRLKHRAEGQVRPVPTPPELTRLLQAHIEEFGTSPSGDLFRGPHGGYIATAAYTEVWAAARSEGLSAAEAASPLAARPYDLRHTAVSTWLAAGVDSSQVANWAGHSVAVLHRVYAHVLSGREDSARQRIDAILDSDP